MFSLALVHLGLLVLVHTCSLRASAPLLSHSLTLTLTPTPTPTPTPTLTLTYALCPAS